MSESSNDEPIRVVGWLGYEDDYSDHEEAGVGGLGGWFGFYQPNTWQDYLDSWKPEAHPYVLALRDAIVARGLREGGDWHQDSDSGVPLFSDGKIATYSYRAWGDLLAAIWSEEDGESYSYMRFYMSDYNN